MRPENFWSSVTERNGHWFYAPRGWKGRTIELHGKNITPARAAWLLTVGPLQARTIVTRECAVDGCINPEHQLVLTRREFMSKNRLERAHRDRKRKQVQGNPTTIRRRIPVSLYEAKKNILHSVIKK